MKLGDSFRASGNLREAELRYRKVIQKDPNRIDAYLRLSETLLGLGQHYAALETLRESVKTAPSSCAAKVSLIDLTLSAYLSVPSQPERLYDEAARHTRDLTTQCPHTFDTLRLNGALASAKKDWPRAVDLFRQANAMKPAGNHSSTMGLARSLFETGDRTESITLVKTVAREDPGFEPAWDLLYDMYQAAGQPGEAEATLRSKAQAVGKVSAYIRLASFLLRAKRTQEMEDVLSSAAELGEDGHLEVGNFYVQLARLDDAIRQFRLGAERYPARKAIFNKRLLETVSARGPLNEALSLARNLSALSPSDTDIRKLLATLLAQSGDSERIREAVNEFESLAKQRPEEPANHFNLGVALQRAGDLDRAQTALRTAAEQDPEYVSPRLKLAEIALHQQKTAESIRFSREALELQRDNVNAATILAIGLIASNEFAEAHAILGGILRRRPDLFQARLPLGVLALAERKFDRAGQIFQELHKPGLDNPAPLVGLLTAWVMQRQFDRALNLLEQELKVSRNPRGVRMMRANVAAAAGRDDLAIGEWELLSAADPKSVEPLMHLAEAKLRRNDTAGSVTALETLERLNPNQVALRARMAFAWEQAGKPHRAIESYRKVLAADPTHIAAMNNLALLLAETEGGIDEALQLSRRCREVAGSRPEVRDTLAWIQFRKDGSQSSVSIFEKLATEHPDNAIYRFHLGAALVSRGNQQRGAEELRAALRNKPDPVTAVRINTVLATAH